MTLLPHEDDPFRPREEEQHLHFQKTIEPFLDLLLDHPPRLFEKWQMTTDLHLLREQWQ